MAPQFIDRLIDHYQILNLAGDGSLGPVYHARDTRLGLEVALQIPRRSVGYRDWPAPVQRAAQQATALNHPGLVALRDYGQFGRQVYLVTEWLAGPSLQSILHNPAVARGLDNPLARAALVGQIGAAVYYLHQHNIFQRDLRPNNIIISTDRQPVYPALTDLGLLKLEQSRLEAHLARLDDGPERLAYLAPEYLAGQPPDERSDIFSLGRLLLTLLLGSVEFAGLAEARHAHSQGQPSELEGLQSTLPALAEIIGKAMATDPAERYPSAQDLTEALAAVTAGFGPVYTLPPQPSPEGLVPSGVPERIEGEAQPSAHQVQPSAAPSPALEQALSEGETADRPATTVEPVGRPRLALQLTPLHLAVTPGQKATILQATVTNTGSQEVQVGLSIDGLPAGWLEPLPAATLSPGQVHTFFLDIKPGKAPETRAGSYNVGVSAVDQTQQVVLAEEQLNKAVKVAHFSDFKSEMRPDPDHIETGKPFRVIVENRGNVEQSYRLDYDDQSDELELTPTTADLENVIPGQPASVTFRPSQRRRRLWHREKHPFSIQITPVPGESQSQTAVGKSRRILATAAGRPMLSPWQLALAALAGLVLISFGLAYRYWSANQPEPVAQSKTTQQSPPVVSSAFPQPATSDPGGEEEVTSQNGTSDTGGLTTSDQPAGSATQMPGPAATNQPPTGRITSPKTGQSFESGQTVPIEVEASDPEGQISKVEFYADNRFIHEDTAAPYLYNWQPDLSGSIELTARVIDDHNQVFETALVKITVKAVASSDPNATSTSKPKPNFTSTPTLAVSIQAEPNPADQGAPITIRAKINPLRDIENVKFTARNTNEEIEELELGTVSNSDNGSYILATSIITTGKYILVATAFENATPSATDSTNIEIRNVLPTVVVVTPTPDPEFYPWQTKEIQARATDVHSIASVLLVYHPDETPIGGNNNKRCSRNGQANNIYTCTLTYDHLYLTSDITVIQVQATDNNGEKTTKPTNGISFSPATPNVSINNPQNNELEIIVKKKTIFEASATKTDLGGIAFNLQRQDDNTSEQLDGNNGNSNNTYQVEWTPTKTGTYVLTATAFYPNNYTYGTSEDRTITVNPAPTDEPTAEPTTEPTAEPTTDKPPVIIVPNSQSN